MTLPSSGGEGNSFENMLQQDTAGARRRRQRLYPRLAAGDRASGDSRQMGLELTVEEFLSRPLNHDIAPPKKVEPTSGALKQKETVQDAPPRNAQPPIKSNKPSTPP